jgi:hypothetical protein
MSASTKSCSRCHCNLPLDAAHFYRDRTSADGFEYRCKACKKTAQRTPEAQEKQRLRMQRWRERNHERDLINSRAWREQNREKAQAATRRYDASPHGKLKRRLAQQSRRQAINQRLRETGYYVRLDQKKRKERWRAANRDKVRQYALNANRPLQRRLKLRYLG